MTTPDNLPPENASPVSLLNGHDELTVGVWVQNRHGQLTIDNDYISVMDDNNQLLLKTPFVNIKNATFYEGGFLLESRDNTFNRFGVSLYDPTPLKRGLYSMYADVGKLRAATKSTAELNAQIRNSFNIHGVVVAGAVYTSQFALKVTLSMIGILIVIALFIWVVSAMQARFDPQCIHEGTARGFCSIQSSH